MHCAGLAARRPLLAAFDVHRRYLTAIGIVLSDLCDISRLMQSQRAVDVPRFIIVRRQRQFLHNCNPHVILLIMNRLQNYGLVNVKWSKR
jgi:hypothetical protein